MYYVMQIHDEFRPYTLNISEIAMNSHRCQFSLFPSFLWDVQFVETICLFAPFICSDCSFDILKRYKLSPLLVRPWQLPSSGWALGLGTGIHSPASSTLFVCLFSLFNSNSNTVPTGCYRYSLFVCLFASLLNCFHDFLIPVWWHWWHWWW